MNKFPRLTVMLLTLMLPVFGQDCIAQDDMMKTVRMDSTMYKLNNMTLDDYANLELPALDVLYENARKSNAVMYYDYQSDYDMHDVKTAKRKPLEWVRLVATYSYGNTDMSAITLMETTYQVWSQNMASQRNNFWNVGVTVSVPLMDIFNTRNNVRQKESKLLQTESRRESELDMVRKDILEQYCIIMEKISVLTTVSQQMVIAQAQYAIAETDFANNKIDAEALYRSKSFESSSKMEYESIRGELNKALLTLEIISCTPIVSDVKLSSNNVK